MPLHSFPFSFRRRLKTALHPVGLAAVLGVVHLLWVRLGSFVSLGLLATIALLLIRGVQWLWAGRAPLRVDDQAVFRAGARVPLEGCELYLRTRREGTKEQPDRMRVDEVVALSPVGPSPANPSGARSGVSFDVSLVDFERALKLLLERVPDARVKVLAPGGKPLIGAPRDALLGPLQSPLARALGQVGGGRLGAPSPPSPPPPPPGGEG